MANSAPPWLTPEEIAGVCTPLKQAAAQARFLQSLGLTVRTKPNGAPLVMRPHLEDVLGYQAKPQPERRSQRVGVVKPNHAALIEHFQQRKGRRKSAG